MRRPGAGWRVVAWALVTLAAIIVLGGVSALAEIGSIGASDGCGGCDATPGWASAGSTASKVLLVAWLIGLAAALLLRHRARRAPAASGRES